MPIDPAKVYTVATNNFMRDGGDGYAVLRDEATNAYDFGPGLEDVLADYLAEHPDYPSRRRGADHPAGVTGRRSGCRGGHGACPRYRTRYTGKCMILKGLMKNNCSLTRCTTLG